MRVWRWLSGRRGDVDEEIQTHLQMAVAERVARGGSPEEARRAAMREFGNVALVREVTRAAWGWEWMERVGQDVRYGVRQLRRSPGFAITVIATLALGLGATAAMFTVVNRVLFRTMPYRDAGRLVMIQESGRRGARAWVPFQDIDQWRGRTRSLKEIAFSVNRPGGRSIAFLDGDTGSQQVSHIPVSTNLFHVPGVQPAMGRGFADEKSAGFAETGDENTVVLSDSVWRDAFGADRKILGRVVKISGQSYTVAGVMPRGFGFPMGGADPQVWTAVALTDLDKIRANHSPTYNVFARLKDGVSVADAEAEMKVIQAEVAKQYTDPYARDLVTSAKVERYRDSLVGVDVRRALLALFAASGVLWLIACVNVTGLLLARGTARQREIAVRGALGASRWRIVRQLLVEGLMLSVGGSVAGLALAVGLLKLFAHGLTTQLQVDGAMPDGRVIGVLLGLTVVSAVVSSMWPAVVSARASIEPALRQGGPQSGAGRGQYRVRGVLVVTQIALSLMLMVSCGLLLRTIYALRHVPLGFRTDHVIVGNMTIPAYKFAGKDMTTELYQPLLERVQHMPGVQSAALMTEVPLGHTFQMMFSFSAEGNGADAVKRRDLAAQFRAVSPDMQKVFGFGMLKGRFFNEGDTPGSPAVVVVNRAFVKEFSASNDPEKMLGMRLFSLGKDRPAIVVGVLDDERQVSVAEQSQPEMEVCLSQITPQNGFYRSAEGMAMDIAVRTERGPASVVPELRELMRKASPELANTKFTTMDQIVEDSYGNQQIAARLLMVFGGSALLLCLAGLYGLLAYLVTQRTRELGVRIALGAQRGHVMWLVMRQAGWMLLCGSALGLGLAYFTSRSVGSFLYGVKPHDAWTMVAVSVLLVGSGLGAAFVPARRAAKVDPMEALRAE
jgi:predicted permease